jgi:hypothetical protein
MFEPLLAKVPECELISEFNFTAGFFLPDNHLKFNRDFSVVVIWKQANSIFLFPLRS